MFVFSLKKQPK